MRYLLFGLLFAFSYLASAADPVSDRRASLRDANVKFSASFEACEDLAKGERKHCRGIAKREHTKAVERIDAGKVEVKTTTTTKSTTSVVK